MPNALYPPPKKKQGPQKTHPKQQQKNTNKLNKLQSILELDALPKRILG